MTQYIGDKLRPFVEAAGEWVARRSTPLAERSIRDARRFKFIKDAVVGFDYDKFKKDKDRETRVQHGRIVKQKLSDEIGEKLRGYNKELVEEMGKSKKRGTRKKSKKGTKKSHKKDVKFKRSATRRKSHKGGGKREQKGNPVSYNYKAPKNHGVKGKMGKDSIVLVGQEFLDNLPTAPTNISGAYIFEMKVNPKEMNIKKLESISKFYERYKFESLSIHFNTAISTAQNGAMIGYFERDPTDKDSGAGVDRIKHAKNHTNSRSTSYHKSCSFVLPKNPGPVQGGFWIDYSGNQRESRQGLFRLVTEVPASTSSSIGAIEIRYKIRMWQNKMDEESDNQAYFGVGASASEETKTYPFGSVSSAFGAESWSTLSGLKTNTRLQYTIQAVGEEQELKGVVYVDAPTNCGAASVILKDSADLGSLTYGLVGFIRRDDGKDAWWDWVETYSSYFTTERNTVSKSDGKEIRADVVARQVAKIPNYTIERIGFVCATENRTTTTSTNSIMMTAWNTPLYSMSYTGIQKQALSKLEELKQLFGRAEQMGLKLEEVVERKEGRLPKPQLSLDVDVGPGDKKEHKNAEIDIREKESGGVARFGEPLKYYLPQHSQGLVQQADKVGNVQRSSDGNYSDDELVVIQRAQRVFDMSEREDERQPNPGVPGGMSKLDGTGARGGSAGTPSVRTSSKK